MFPARTRTLRPFDLRFTEPNKESAIEPAAMHSIEHLMATWFRNSDVKDDVVYVGPMGCLTGMYVIMQQNKKVQECLNEMLNEYKQLAIEKRNNQQKNKLNYDTRRSNYNGKPAIAEAVSR